VGAAQRNKMTVLLKIETPESLELAYTLSPHGIAYGDPLYGRLEQTIQELKEVRAALPAYLRVMLMHPLQTLDEVEAALSVRVHALLLGDALLNNEKKVQQVRLLIQSAL
jgi:indole-3-glycerol phosphate synthase